jgi:large-conductance mechanosensitive channel
MFNFYTILDLDNSRVGLALHANSFGQVKDDVISDDNPYTPRDPKNPKTPSSKMIPVWAIIIIAIIGVIIIAVVLFLIIKKVRNGKKNPKELAVGI